MTPYVCLSRDVDEGQYRALHAFDTELIVWRENGALLAARNACPHRGFPIATGCGTLPVSCPYHGLKFGKKPLWKLAELSGFAFLTPHGIASSEIADMLDVGCFHLMGEEFGRVEAVVRAPYTLWIQNTMDPQHLLYVHPGFVSIFATPLEPHDVSISGDKMVSSYRLCILEHVADRYARNLGVDIPESFFHGVVAPHLSVTSFLNVFFSVEAAEPMPDGNTRVTTRFLARKDAQIPKRLLSLAMARNRSLLAEDRDIVERWALGRPWVKPKFWMPGEERVHAYATMAEAIL